MVDFYWDRSRSFRNYITRNVFFPLRNKIVSSADLFLQKRARFRIWGLVYSSSKKSNQNDWIYKKYEYLLFIYYRISKEKVNLWILVVKVRLHTNLE